MAVKKKQYVLARRYTALGDYLQKMRLEANLTQRYVSLKLGYSSAQFISNFERGIAVPPVKKLKVLIKLYGLNPSELIDLINTTERNILSSALGEKLSGQRAARAK